ncbi:pilus assembly protein TadG-related protein [Sphingomonas psychrotolerans]|uniref:Pilus assembly protein TadG-related protein n=1 Tax=Sphingomonas psychrotolerans TaxID=1327635 RepID=A0ABU3N0F5_9SPHN|nr:pilus assembly protein TadG-related protein [Sphingomonas psychrotolerans]MDT8758044.1 pilus assembly protein TadG-related protein [Sphingomonas psychrotolerans]
MTRLARDTRGNTLAIIGIALIPLAGIVGGGIDISRMYIVKTRLQHACDAAALAGRKAMGAGTWNQTGTIDGVQETNYPLKIAQRYFDGNFDKTAYGGTDPQPQFIETGGKVSGSVSVSLPMTLMKIFGKTTETLSVTCEADMRLPNTDVMFVLDNTGSMADTPSGDSQSKLQSLKDAVKCFYEIVARLDTTEECTTGNPSGGVGAETQVRFGFVLYDTNVNVGKLLPTAYLADNWAFRSREIDSIAYPTAGTPSETSSSIAWGTTGSWQLKVTTKSGTSDTNCSGKIPTTTVTATGPGVQSQFATTESPGYRTVTYKEVTPVNQSEYRFNSYKSNTCYYDKRDTPGTKTAYMTRTDTAQVTWHYGMISQNVAGLKNGTNAWNNSIQVRINTNGAMKTVGWEGCISERHTDQDINFSAATLPTTAMDLDIDTVPTAGDPNSLWGPVMKDMIYTPKGSKSNWDKTDQYTTTNYSNGSGYSCLAESRKLQEWKDSSIFENYVDSMRSGSNTYHDIGLIWGARLMSPTGIFKTENAATPKGGEIQRHMIFMTDGDPCTAAENYTAYGVAWFDHLQTVNDQAADGVHCTEGTALTDQVNARTQAICKEIKKRDITLWVVTFGYVDPRTVTRMTTCASDGRYFSANNKADLQATFKKIADQISALRLTN